MKKYLAFFGISFKTNFAYKVDFIFSLALDVVFFFISFALWRAIYSDGGLTQINTYSLRDTITYFFATAIIFRFDVFDSIYLNWEIWDGSFANDLVRPWYIPLLNFIDTITEKIITFALYIPILFIIFFAARNFVELPSLAGAICFGITIILSMVMSFALNLIFHSLCFYFGDQSGTIELIGYIAIFLGGAIFPLSFLPKTLEVIFNVLPFKYLFYVPVQIFLGKLSTGSIFLSWASIIVWTIIFYLIFLLLYKNGLKRFTGTGR